VLIHSARRRSEGAESEPADQKRSIKVEVLERRVKIGAR
jgi:hypothetical protein